MHSSLDATVRRRVLADIGIDIWRLRAPGDTQLSETAAAVAPPVGVTADVAPGLADTRRRAETMGRDPAVEPSGATVHSVPVAAWSEAPPSDVPVDAPFEILGLAVAGVVMLLDRRPEGRESRLLRDLLAAAAADWSTSVDARRFAWPPDVPVPGADNAGAAERALMAFVTKFLGDSEAQLLLLGPGVVARLGGLVFDGMIVSLPESGKIGRDSGEKRRLWAEIARHRSRALERG